MTSVTADAKNARPLALDSQNPDPTEETMHHSLLLRSLLLATFTVASIFGLHNLKSSGSLVSAQNQVTQGSLQVVDPNGQVKAICPLKHTSVKAQISGFLARATVTQEFENPFKEKIEAV